MFAYNSRIYRIIHCLLIKNSYKNYHIMRQSNNEKSCNPQENINIKEHPLQKHKQVVFVRLALFQSVNDLN